MEGLLQKNTGNTISESIRTIEVNKYIFTI